MKAVAVILVLVGVASGLSLDEQQSKNRPVTKVINLLKDMQSQLEKEGEEDEEVYDKMVCWCETNDKEKTKAIADGEHKISELAASIEDLTANSAKLTSEIATLESEVAKNTAALEKATAMRSKELDEFNAEDKEALQSIAGLKSAVTVLGKHNSAAFLQTGTGMKQELAKIVGMLSSTRMSQYAKETDLMPSQRRALASFIQAPEDYILGLTQQMPSAGSYAPQSGQIFGILKNMKESFEANAAAAQKEEADAVKQYQEMKAAKDDEIAAGTSQIEAKTQELATSDEKCATDKQSKKDSENTLTADREFLANLKETCASLDAQMEERQKTRTLEIEACSKALAVLSSDDAHDLFTKTFNFIQVRQDSSSKRRDVASRVLAAAAKRNRNPKLGMLATAVRLDAFKNVQKSIQKMVDQLVKEKEDEIQFKDYCIDSLNDNEHQTQVKDKAKEDLIAKVDDLRNTVAALTSDIKGLEASIAEMRKQMKRSGEDRELENKAFQETVADQRATQKLLQSALDILKGFYDLVQTSSSSQGKKQTPPVSFKSYENNENSGGVMGMIQTIISDAKTMEAEAITGEADAQKAYENIVKETNQSIDASTKEITNTSEARAKAEGELSESETSLDAVMAELDGLAQQNRGLHGECDFVVKNFDTRQSSRDDELEALKDSISILSGATI